MARTCNIAGKLLTKEFESCRLEAYPDPGTGGDPWTIGWGCTHAVSPGMKISQEEADRRFESDMELTALAVDAFAPSCLSENQFSALCAFAYNVKGWKTSPLLRLVQAGNLEEAANHIPLYDKANGKEMLGLKIRRLAEQKLFLARGDVSGDIKAWVVQLREKEKS